MSVRTTVLGMALCLLVSWSAALSAQVPAQDDAPRIAELIKQLGDDKPDIRDAAQKELADMGEAAAPALERAARENKDPEISVRVHQLLDALEHSIWDPLLTRTLREDAEFLEDLSALENREKGAKVREGPENYLRIAAETDATLLAEPMRFFRIRGSALGYDSRPVEYFKIALLKSGKAVLLSARNRSSNRMNALRGGGFDEVRNLRRVLAPAKNAEGAVKAAILAAKMLVFCAECTPDAVVDPAICTAEAIPEGGWRVTIPAQALANNKNEESATLTFDGEGRVVKAEQTGHPMGHR